MVYEFPQGENLHALKSRPMDNQRLETHPMENQADLVSTEKAVSIESVSTEKKNLGSPSGERASGGDFQDELQALYEQELRKPQRDPDDSPKTPGQYAPCCDNTKPMRRRDAL